MKFELTKRLKKKIKEINKKQPLLSKRIQKQLSIFQENPRHPSLRTHKPITLTLVPIIYIVFLIYETPRALARGFSPFTSLCSDAFGGNLHPRAVTRGFKIGKYKSQYN